LIIFSPLVYLVKLTENENQPAIIPLNLRPQSHSFSIFSLQYSVDASEIIGGSNDTCVYIYDLHKQRRTLRVNIKTKKTLIKSDV
jgi:WD repeat-containing protein 23